MELLITIYGNKWGLGVLGCISAAMDVQVVTFYSCKCI